MLMVNQLIGFGAGSGAARPEIFGTVSSVETGTGAASLTLTNHVVESGTTLLIVRVHQRPSSGNANPTGVTWNGVAMTLAVGATGLNGVNMSIWYLVNPTPATANIVASFSPNFDSAALHAVNIRNTGESPIGATGTNTGTSTQRTHNITTTAVDPLLISGVVWRTGGTPPLLAWTAPLIERYDDATGSGTANCRWGGAEDATQTAIATVTVTVDTTGASDASALATVEIKGG